MRTLRLLKSLITASILICVALLLVGSQLQLANQKVLSPELGSNDQLTPTEQLALKFRDFRTTQVNCIQIINGNAYEINKGIALSSNSISYHSDFHYAMETTCTDHFTNLVTKTLSDEERQFPLAFSIMVYKQFDQVLRLLKAIYRPEHCYCIHADSKSSTWFRAAVRLFAGCLDNVIFAEPSVNIQWSRYSVLEAELLCWRLLIDRCKNNWRYLINLTGQEYPLRTMKELVTILKQLNGANNIENVGVVTSYDIPLQLSSSVSSDTKSQNKSSTIAWHKGSVHVVVCRGFAEYVFSPVGMALQRELRSQDAQRQREPPTDEVLFATLNYNTGVLRVPGAPLDTSLITDNVKLPFLPRYKNWITGLFGYPCLSGRITRDICIWGLADLPAMNRRFELFANKFFADFQPLALRCLEERFWHNSLADYGVLELNKTWNIDVASYSNYSFVYHHV